VKLLQLMDSARASGPGAAAGAAAAATAEGCLPPPSPATTPAAAAAAESLPVLDSVLDYEKIHRVGEGTYGVVYKGMQGFGGFKGVFKVCSSVKVFE
jgi:hypothetical protein